jgi:hypothetical protein
MFADVNNGESTNSKADFSDSGWDDGSGSETDDNANADLGRAKLAVTGITIRDKPLTKVTDDELTQIASTFTMAPPSSQRRKIRQRKSPASIQKKKKKKKQRKKLTQYHLT